MVPSPLARARRTHRRVLLVDDDVISLRSIARGMSTRGYQVDCASTHAQALDVIRTRPPEMAVIDLFIGEDSGLDVLSSVRRANGLARCVIVTGYSSVATAMEAIRRGATDYLFKPTTADQMVRSLDPDAIDPPTLLPTPEGAYPSLARMEWEYISQVLRACKGNVSSASRILQIPRRTLQRKLRKYPPAK